MIEVKSCPVCGASSFKEVFKAPYFRGDNELFAIQECNSCKFWVTSPRPEDADLGKYYDSANYISHNNSSKSLMDKAYQVVRNYSLKKKVQLISRIDNGSKSLLDYGAGTGHFLLEAKKSGWKIEGVEISGDAREVAKKDNALSLHNPEGFKIEGGKYSVITLWHVLEHLPNLNEHLQSFYEGLQSGGELVIAVPNHESSDSKHYGENWAALDVPLHLWHFKKSNIQALAEKHGFVFKEALNMPFDSFYVSLLSEKIGSAKGSSLKALTTGLMSNLKGKSDKNMSSLIYILERP
ncbi:class I SAM-dependent methyltransferase [Owenweeksia hongkongensis]|uniref:class I SAM-dependent methyltransferase n=1 Tax=Owenweeksia hongkongensis TaxID=253245 RepID=UPI003A95D06A